MVIYTPTSYCVKIFTKMFIVLIIKWVYMVRNRHMPTGYRLSSSQEVIALNFDKKKVKLLEKLLEISFVFLKMSNLVFWYKFHVTLITFPVSFYNPSLFCFVLFYGSIKDEKLWHENLASFWYVFNA